MNVVLGGGDYKRFFKGLRHPKCCRLQLDSLESLVGTDFKCQCLNATVGVKVHTIIVFKCPLILEMFTSIQYKPKINIKSACFKIYFVGGGYLFL